MNAKGTKWLFKRLLAMSPSEVQYRILQLIKKKFWKYFKPNYRPNFDYQLIDFRKSPLGGNVGLTNPKLRSQLLLEADQYLDHKWLFFGLNAKETPIDWHTDPVSKIKAPLKFGFDINHRDERLVGNIKNTWEKNRHHHLTILALAFHLTNEEKYAKEVVVQLKDWINQNPFLIGVNWTHPLEQGIRLISWVFIFFFLKGSEFFDDLFGKSGIMWKSIFEHQKFIVETYSKGSSANNHLIGEMAGLFISSCYWPIYNQSDGWNKLSHEILEKELIAQNYSDGVNKELAFSYQIFVLEFGLLSFIVEPDLFSDEYKEILRKMCHVGHTLRSIIGHLPNYGDGDEGMALQVQPYDADRLNWLISLSNQFLDTAYPSEENLPQFLFDSALNKPKELDDTYKFISKAAGLAALKWDAGANTFAILVDFGPLGMGSLAAHGHADALSFTLSIDDKPFIVDPGTFCYHDNLHYREYFRSVRAHNTLNINGKDQSEQLGPFLWGSRPNVILEHCDLDSGYIEARHDGYVSEGVFHSRSYHQIQKGLKIIDTLEGDGKKEVEIRFHFHPSVKPELIENGICRFPPLNILLKFPENLSLSILYGDSDGGWYSPSFGTKQKSYTLVLRQTLSLPANLDVEILTD